MNVRRATLQDLPALMSMVKAFHYAAHLKRWATFEDSEPSWRAWFEGCIASQLCLFAEHEGRPAGFATALASKAYWNPSVVTVHEAAMWVDPECRGSGVGGALVDAIVAWGREKGAAIVAAGTAQELNPKAMGGLLRKHGFRLHEQIYSRGVD